MQSLKKLHRPFVFVPMAADLLHHGHINILLKAKKYGTVIVGLMTDNGIKTYKKKKPLVHYFIGSIPYSSEELDGNIQLQWEVAEYFCGDLEEIEEKMGEGATQNLKNVVEMFKQENLMLERAYPHSKGHSRKKRRLVGLGGSRTTGAKGLKRLKNFKRPKSAAVGFGVFEESSEKKTKKIKISIRR